MNNKAKIERIPESDPQTMYVLHILTGEMPFEYEWMLSTFEHAAERAREIMKNSTIKEVNIFRLDAQFNQNGESFIKY